MLSKLWDTLEKKNHTYYEQDPEKVALFLKKFNSLKHLAPVYIDETKKIYIESSNYHRTENMIHSVQAGIIKSVSYQ